MVPSEAIPNAMLNIRIVDGLRGMLKNPIIPAVISKGIRLGKMETAIILNDIKSKNMIMEIKNIASNMLSIRLVKR